MSDNRVTLEPPSYEQIIELNNKNKEQFKSTIKEVGYKRGGLWHSEMLTFISCCKYYNPDKIVESGRFLGYSTEVLSEFFKNEGIDIISIDDRETVTEHFSEERVQNRESELNSRNNITLKNGDGRKIAPRFVDSKTCVLIDGPKNDNALYLAMDLLTDKQARCVGVHDLRKSKFVRNISELIFYYNMYTDDERIVSEFRDLDESIHEYYNEVASEGNEVGPYLNQGEKVPSYGPTLGIFFTSQNPIDEQAQKNYYDYTKKNPSFRWVLSKYLNKTQDEGGPISKHIAANGLKLLNYLYKIPD